MRGFCIFCHKFMEMQRLQKTTTKTGWITSPNFPSSKRNCVMSLLITSRANYSSLYSFLQVNKLKSWESVPISWIRMWSSLSSRHLEAQHNINVKLHHVAETSMSNNMFAWDPMPQQTMLWHSGMFSWFQKQHISICLLWWWTWKVNRQGIDQLMDTRYKKKHSLMWHRWLLLWLWLLPILYCCCCCSSGCGCCCSSGCGCGCCCCCCGCGSGCACGCGCGCGCCCGCCCCCCCCCCCHWLTHHHKKKHISHTMSSLYPPVLQHLSGILGMGQIGPTSTLHDGSSWLNENHITTLR